MDSSWIMLQYVDLQTCLVFGIVFLVIYYVSTGERIDVPGPFTFPVIGNFITIVLKQRQGANWLKQLQDQYGNLFRLYFGPHLVVILCGKDNIYDAFVKQAEVFSDRPNQMTIFKDRTEHGIVWSNGHTWKVLRRLSLQSMRDFGLGKKNLEDRILDECNVVLEEIGKTAGQSFSIRDLYKNAVSNITHSIIFGHRMDYSDPAFVEVMKNIEIFFSLGLGIFSPTAIWPRLSIFGNKENIRANCLNNMSKYVKEEIEEHRSSFDENNIRDFIDIYLDTEKNGTDKDILTKGQMLRVILQLFNAGTDTTAATLSWSVLYMIQYPGVQKNCRQEIEEVVGHGRQVHLSDRPKLKYVESTLLEIQRLSNVARASLPHMATKDATVGGYRIPKGTIVIGYIASANEDMNHWEDPLDFNPSRFLDPDNNIRKTDAFMPFSVGPRVCPGEPLAKTVMFLMFCNTLQRFDLQKEDREDFLSFDGIAHLTTVPKPYKLRACPMM